MTFAGGIVVSDLCASCQMTRARVFKSLWVGVRTKVGPWWLVDLQRTLRYSDSAPGMGEKGHPFPNLMPA